MDKGTNINDLLAQVQAVQGEDFKYDAEGVAGEYVKRDAERSALIIKLLSVAGSFLATVAFFAFLMITGFFNWNTGLIVFGIITIAAPVLVTLHYNKLIIDTSATTTYIAGLISLGIGIQEAGNSSTIAALVLLAVSAAALFIIRNYMLVFTSVIIACLCILYLLTDIHYNLVHLYIALLAMACMAWFTKEAAVITYRKRLISLYNPVRAGLLISFFIGLCFVCKRGLFSLSVQYMWMSSVVLSLIVLYLINRVLTVVAVTDVKIKGVIYALSMLLLAAIAFAPAITGAILLAFLCFIVNYRTGLGIGIVALIYFVCQYYYDLQLSLLVKSGIMFFSGLLFIILYLITNNLTAHERKV